MDPVIVQSSRRREVVSNANSDLTRSPHTTETGGVTAGGAVLKASQNKGKENLLLPEPELFIKKLLQGDPRGELLLKHQQRLSVTQSPRPSRAATDAYDMEAVNAIRDQDIPKLRKMLRAGKSLDACNRFGESLLHMACRRGHAKVVEFLVREAGVSTCIRDDFGRTPVHDACWTASPNFDVMDVLIQNASPDLLVGEDIRGHSPFRYARKEHWSNWIKYLKEREALINKRICLAAIEFS